VELYFHFPYVFIVWCLLKNKDGFTIMPLDVINKLAFVTEKQYIPRCGN
jgi:hypothetical protein